MRLIDKYKPRTLADIIGQDKAIARIERMLNRPGFDGDSFWIVGPSGTGKTTLAEVIARMFAAEIDIVELDGEACTIDAVRQATGMMRYSAMGGGFRVWIVNEAQAMTPRAVQAWLTALDRLPSKVIVIFTTTEDSADLFGQYDGPFMSKCKAISFTNQGLAKPYAERLRQIAQAENLDGQPESAYLALVRRCKNNMRAALQAIESGEMIEG